MKAALPTVLIVDGDPRSRDSLANLLRDQFDIFSAGDGGQAMSVMEREYVQVILCDQGSLPFLRRARERWPETVRIVIAGEPVSGTLAITVEDGTAWQCVERPWRADGLRTVVRNAAQLFALQREKEQLAIELKTLLPSFKRGERAGGKSYLDRLVHAGESPIEAACEMVRRVAPYDIAVLLTGESGTGKELMARALHHSSPRAARPFVAENCGALTDQLLESELFGHCKGSFTGAVVDHVGLFEQADGGTIFLDEIGETSPMFQVKLLRVLQEGEVRPVGGRQRRRVDVRLIAATNRDLEAEVRAGRFRQDLYFRLATVTIQLAPLRHRPMDIPLLAQSLLQEAMGHLGRRVRGFTREALECMQRYYWPGNVREMRNEIQRMLILADDQLLGAELLSPKVRLAAPPEEEGFDLLAGIDGTLRERIESLEARILRETLMRHRWNKSRAALELGLSRVGLRSKLVRYGLERGDEAEEGLSDRATENEGLH